MNLELVHDDLHILQGSTRMRVVSTPDKNLLLKQYNDLQSKLLALDKEIAELDTELVKRKSILTSCTVTHK